MKMNTTGKLSAAEVLKDAFGYIKNTLFYQILMSLIYASAMGLAAYSAGSRLGILDQYLTAAQQLKISPEAYTKALNDIANTPSFRTFSYIIYALQIFLYPLNFGLFKIYRKSDLKQSINVQDLFAGYLGSNFFAYTSFFLFWLLSYNILLSTVFLAPVWVAITLFCAPLLFFQNKRIFEGISLSVKAFRLHALPISLCILTAIVIRYGGMLSVVLFPVAFPVWTAMVYSLYSKIFVEDKN